MDVMVAPERQRQGLGEVLFRMWDRNVGASLGLGLSDASYRLFQKLRWPDVGPVPCFVKPLTRRALRRPNWPVGVNRLVSALTLPVVKVVARNRPLAAEVRMIQRFDESFTELWNELAPKFNLAVRRDAAYLNWKYVNAPHVRYSIAALRRDNRNVGYAVYRHYTEPRGRVTILVDFLADPADEQGVETLLRWVDREARQADSDKIRTFAMHAGFRRVLRRSGYFAVKSTMEFVVKINGLPVDRRSTSRPTLARHARRLGPRSMKARAMCDCDARGASRATSVRCATAERRARAGKALGVRPQRKLNNASPGRHRYRRRQPVGRARRGCTSASRTSTRCRGCMRCSRGMACGRRM